jgi:hypothetical protein
MILLALRQVQPGYRTEGGGENNSEEGGYCPFHQSSIGLDSEQTKYI